MIFVNGGSSAVGGQAPDDAGNRRNDVGAAGDTLGIANWVVDNYGGPGADRPPSRRDTCG